MHYLITGGTGFIGRALCRELLRREQRVTVLTRSRQSAAGVLPGGVKAIERLDEIRQDVPGAIINLAGENLAAARWNEARKQRFVASRVETTRALVDFMRRTARRPRVLVSGSAIGWYGARGDEELTEDSAPGDEFQSRLCRVWEEEALKAETLGVRVCRVRTGIVLGDGGGPLAKMLPPFKLGLGGPIGSGRQWMSWIHRSDLIALMLWLAQNEWASGAFNGTAPHPVGNREFARVLGAVLHRPALMPMPGYALKLLVGEMAHLLLTGQRVLPARAGQLGFAFQYPRLDTALAEILR